MSKKKKKSDINAVFRVIDDLHIEGPLPQGGPVATPSQGGHITDCGKHGFLSEKACRTAIKNRLRKGGDTTYLRPFWCKDCHHWHMTSLKNFKS